MLKEYAITAHYEEILILTDKTTTMKKEETLQLQVCNYLRLQYPNIVFSCDLASGMKLTVGQAVKAKKMRSNRGMPDLMIFAPSADHYYHGLFLELKAEGTTIYKKDGLLVADEHIREQAAVLDELRGLRYAAHFACGFEEAKRSIDFYFKKLNK